MALSIPQKVKSLFRLRLRKRRKPKQLTPARRQSSSHDDGCREEVLPPLPPLPPPAEVKEDEAPVTRFSEQPNSSFFQKLPIEVRKTIYSYLWPGAYDHMYHVPNGRHIVFKKGRWYNMRCVMSEVDEDGDLIQKNMDHIYETGHGDLLMWQRRLSSTWGTRHWRCEERVEYGQIGAIDRTDFESMMLVCKRMYPEVVESIFESHKLIFNDLFSAHRFFVHHPSPYISHLRHLDLTLHTAFRECSPLIINLPKSRVREVLDAVKSLPSLHSLRVSVDICDRGPWRKLPERDLATHLRDCQALKEFVVELPPLLAGKTHLFDGQDLDAAHNDNQESPTSTPTPSSSPSFTVIRRPPLRYWQFHPGEVEHFKWETFRRGNQPHCRITLAKSGTAISNPYLVKPDERAAGQ